MSKLIFIYFFNLFLSLNTIELEKLEKIVSKIQNNLSLKKPDLVYHDNLEEFKYRIKIYDIHLFFNYESRTISNSTEKEIIPISSVKLLICIC